MFFLSLKSIAKGKYTNDNTTSAQISKWAISSRNTNNLFICKIFKCQKEKKLIKYYFWYIGVGRQSPKCPPTSNFAFTMVFLSTAARGRLLNPK